MYMKSLLIFPEDESDAGLKFAKTCALELVEYLQIEKHEFGKLTGNNITVDDVITSLTEISVKNFLAFGHGNETGITIRSDTAPVFEINNASLLKDRLCYFLSCCTGKELGPEAIHQGAIAFIGFVEKFWFISDQSKDFVDCCLSGIQEYLLGKCKLTDIEGITKKKFDEKIDHYLSINNNQAAMYFNYDITKMVFLIKS